jgi:serpin B
MISNARFLPICLIVSSVFLISAQAQAPVSAFPSRFYQTLASAQKDRNFVFSPFSISQAFGLAELGARGETRQEIDSVIQTQAPKLDEKVDPNDQRPHAEVVVANRIWLQKGAPVEKSYLEASQAKFGAVPGYVDFLHHADVATTTINDWVSSLTHQKIQNLIPPSTLNSRSRVVLTNAIYFKAAWRLPFDKKDTSDDDFVLSSGRKAHVPFMHERKHLIYSEDDRVRVLALPYEDARYSMKIVLPKDGRSLAEVEHALSPSVLAEWEKKGVLLDVKLAMPRFRFDSSFLLNEPLEKLGIHRAFVSGQADFSGIDGTKNLYIAQVFHQAYLKVDEAGTEAAAATAIHMGMLALQHMPKTIDFTVNHPFLFMIEDTESGSILFMGRVTNPRD